jgi:hypothetical protein
MYLRIIIFVLLVSGAVGYFYYSQNKMQQLAERASRIEQQNEQYKLAISELQSAMARQRLLSEQYSEEARRAQALANEAMAVFDRHNLEFLSYAKPNLIEKRINDATDRLFREIENEINR